MNSDIEIAQSIELKHIKEIASKIGIKEDQLHLFGKYKAKLPNSLIDFDKIEKSNLILVTAISPYPSRRRKNNNVNWSYGRIKPNR